MPRRIRLTYDLLLLYTCGNMRPPEEIERMG